MQTQAEKAWGDAVGNVVKAAKLDVLRPLLEKARNIQSGQGRRTDGDPMYREGSASCAGFIAREIEGMIAELENE